MNTIGRQIKDEVKKMKEEKGGGGEGGGGGGEGKMIRVGGRKDKQ